MHPFPRIALPLALGAMVTLAVSTGIAAFGSWRDPTIVATVLAPRGSGVSSIRVSQAFEPGILSRTVGTYDPQTGLWAEPTNALPLAFSTRVGEPGDFAPWGRLREALAGGQVTAAEQARGWPFPAFRAVSTDGVRYRGGITFRDPLDRRGNSPDPVIPLVPIWSWFALDTLLYAAAMAVPLEAALLLRRRWRVAGHRCPACGYALAGIAAGSPCPECGRPA